jgi:hypothetical protein
MIRPHLDNRQHLGKDVQLREGSSAITILSVWQDR